MKTDFRSYPPALAADVEIAPQQDGEQMVFIAGAASVGRYLLLRAAERRVLSLLDGERTVGGVCEAFQAQTGSVLAGPTLIKFLNKLDQYGLLAGERVESAAAPESPQSQMHYIRFSLFNPDAFLARLVWRLRWIWTTGFFAFSACLIVLTFFLALMNWADVIAYGATTLRDHYVAIFIAAWLVGVTHEFAHGATCKAFGGRATEVGGLLVYYVLPALYCNVSGIHLIPTRGRRLWVIAAGVYWQLLVGAVSLLAWFLLAPHTRLSDLAFIVLLGSVLDVFFNANPLIKLDGYYFLSQWLRLPNLMDRSRACWRGQLQRALFGERSHEMERWSRREQVIYLIFGLLSFVYNLLFAALIVIYTGEWLVDRFYFPGLLLAFGVALLFARRPIRQAMAGLIRSGKRTREGEMADKNQNTSEAPSPVAGQGQKTSRLRRRLVPLAVGFAFVVVLLMPWRASVGDYGTLIALPNKETIIRAPESATLVALRVQPGDRVAGGAVLGRMGNFDLEEQIVAVQTDLSRAGAEYDRLLGERRTRGEIAARAGLQMQQRQLEYSEIEAERRQIADEARERQGDAAKEFLVQKASSADRILSNEAIRYPAALAVLQTEVDSRRAQAAEAATHRDRVRALQGQGILPRSELDAAESRAATLRGALTAASRRLDAALIEHRRKHASVTIDVNIAQADLAAERAQLAKLEGELNGARDLIRTLESRRDLLARKRAQFDLVAPAAGAIFGEELPRMIGQYFQKGAEICRVAETRELLVRIQVSEREIGDVRAGNPVRLKVRSDPDSVFRGVVSKIGGESEPDRNGQPSYRVELTIENPEGILRPGMTAFARIDFGRRAIGAILLHKIKQALRPELWML
ncbi:MAG: HlyD family efflux transporter periplasmic adaptor subunit [Blastocatellia bacterium]|nr:HlyD family efflux transporter periplasmic adaptor subunit [Blastocatellia bacterium]